MFPLPTFGKMGSNGGSVFSPARLFAAGEVGAWYQPDDFSTLFQDSAGTTPVTAVEQPVGLMLDKSKGLVLGSNVVANGTFDTDTAWTKGTSWTISDGTANAGGTGSSLTQSVSVVSNTLYKITFTVVSLSLGNVRVQFQGGTAVVGSVRAAAGTFTEYLNSGNNTTLAFVSGGTTPDAKIDSVSVQALPGNHAYQTASTSRPTLRARYNLLTYSEQFDNAAWTKNSLAVTQNTVVSPNGETTADTITLAAATGGKNINHAVSAPALSRFSIYAKAGSHNFIQVFATGDAGYVNVNLSTGTFTASGATGTVTSAGNGWYHITVTFSAALTGAYIGAVNSTAAVRAESWTASGTETFYIWGADLRVANDGVNIPAYQRIAAATDYDTSGFPVYLDFCESFGGTNSDNSMLTNSIDFSGTDKVAVFAGVRKLSDAAQSVVAELSATIASNNGTFLLSAPNSAAANYNFSSKGTTQVDNTVTTYTAPITSVIAATGNISAPSNIIRINGSQAGSQTGSQGTGNYGNFAMYIGRRNNASLPASMRLYGLVVRGAASTDVQIASTETWLNGRVKAY